MPTQKQNQAFLRPIPAIAMVLAAIFIFTASLQAQPKYGILSTTTVTPPYPVTLDGFVADGGTKLSLQILPTDINIVNYPVLLKLVISGNGITLESKSLFIHDPIYLNGNELTQLNGSDLQAFFNPNNLNFNGYSQTQYQRNGRLPEGVYTVGFELYDVLRKIKVSNVRTSLIFLFLNEVPSLDLPLNGDLISAAGTQAVNFRWTTRHSALAGTFFTSEYLFEIWDIVPDGSNPNDVVRGTRPYYANTLSAAYVAYGIAEPQLQLGHTYAWRVRESDPEGRTLFKNDGYSDVHTFTYGRNCPAPDLKVDKIGTSYFTVTWQADVNQKQFELRFRDKKKQNSDWYTQTSNLLSGRVDNLKSNNPYEVEICGICGDQRSDYSNLLEVTTRQNTSFKCGQVDSSKIPQNKKPLSKLVPKDVFKAFGFDVEVTQASGGAGTFTGKGYVLVPLLNFIKIEVQFNSIQINEEYELIGGEVKTVYNLSNSLVYIPGQGVLGLSDLTDLAKLLKGDKEDNPFTDIADKTVQVDSVDNIKVENGKVTITDANGNTTHADTGKITAVKTSDGDQYVVDSNGTVYSSGNSGQKASGTPAGAVTTASQAGKGSPKYNVSFIPHALQECGFDNPTDKSPADNYDKAEITGSSQPVPWKSFEVGHIERVVAEINGGPADSVKYYRQSNNMVMTAPGVKETQKQIMLSGTDKNEEDKLFAWYPQRQADTSKTYNRILAGQLNMISYERIKISVVIIPVNGSSCPEAGYVQQQLNNIYKSAVVDWDVKMGKNLKVTFANSVFDNTSPSDEMDYTDDMNLAIDSLEETTQYNKDTYFLFFLDDAKDGSIKGYMPLKQQFGFIFKYKQYPDEYTRTIAHELGHGPFRLWHTFSTSNKYVQPKGSTDNLMDYASATALKINKYQWDWIHDPEWRLYWFTDKEEAEAKDCPASKPNFVGSHEGEEFTTSAETGQKNVRYGEVFYERCFITWYYFTGDPSVSETKGWYTKSQYKEILKKLGVFNNKGERNSIDIYPEGILKYDNLNNEYTLRAPVIHIFNLMNGIDETLLTAAKIWKRGPGKYLPFYSIKEAGGAITLPKDDYYVIIFTENFFSGDKYTNYGYAFGLDYEAWLDQLAHEVGHLPQAAKKGSLMPYVFEFLKQYVTSGSHDAAPYELEAECRKSYYTAFYEFTQKYFGNEALISLLRSDKSDQEKINKIDIWNKSFTEYTRLIYSGRNPNTINRNELIN